MQHPYFIPFNQFGNRVISMLPNPQPQTILQPPSLQHAPHIFLTQGWAPTEGGGGEGRRGDGKEPLTPSKIRWETDNSSTGTGDFRCLEQRRNNARCGDFRCRRWRARGVQGGNLRGLDRVWLWLELGASGFLEWFWTCRL